LFYYIICYCCWFSFMFVLLPCSIRKSRVIKFWGFFMYLLFLGIVRNNTMKLDDALTQIGKLCSGKNWVVWCCMLFLASYRGRSTETGSLTSRILCKVQRLNSKLELFHSLFIFIVPNLGAPFRLKRNQDWKKTKRRWEKVLVWAMAFCASAGVLFFGLFSSLFLTSSAFHCFKGES